MARNPSHLGSNRKSPSGGRASSSLASIGSIGGVMGNSGFARRGGLMGRSIVQHGRHAGPAPQPPRPHGGGLPPPLLDLARTDRSRPRDLGNGPAPAGPARGAG